MMKFDEFFDRVDQSKLTLPARPEVQTMHLLGNEALFQLPLIALIILLMAKDRRKPKIAEIGQLVGESIEASLIGFKGSSQHLGWSANLRVRTVKALNFLELTNLVEIPNRKARIAITEMGKRVIGKALENDDDLAYNLAKIGLAYRNICVSRQLDLELT
ncbi:hypothetical protein NX773_09485 [Massilia solisilvae]|uniref:MarR family transcriptional regulator n=1 Tax=Massilia solisilvae TaxID=1811225 RepID=A0ABT2BIU4_9BURK|nr:hypothetical protein [Massilia solisilvae]MCS0608392.1 hypothetical protein [Massilia solisilvae]